MTLKIVEGLATVDAAVQRLACCGPELAQQLGIGGLAQWAGAWPVVAREYAFVDRTVGWRNAVGE